MRSYMASALKNILDLKAFIVLWGSGKSGKSSTLRNLFEELGKNSQGVVPASRQKEFRIIIEYRGIFIYLSTCGDTLEDTQANIAFFDGELDSKNIFIYRVGSSVNRMETGVDYLHEYQPSFCISANRGEGRVPYPLDYYGHKMQIHTSAIVWLHKEKESDVSAINKANHDHALQIKEFIDRKIDNHLI